MTKKNINIIDNAINDIKSNDNHITMDNSLDNKSTINDETINDETINDDYFYDTTIDIKPFKNKSKINNFPIECGKITNMNNAQDLNKNTNDSKNVIPHIATHPKNSNDFLKEMLMKQLPNINISKKLTFNDMKRITKFLTSSIFDEDNCSVWNGYITNEKNQIKGTYINFYFNQKKIALHRLLYLNFIGEILNTEYIKYTCANKGKCCNIHHMKKYSYNLTNIPDIVEPQCIDNGVHIVQTKNNLVIEL